MRTILLAVFVLTTMGWGASSAATKELSSAVWNAISMDENTPDFDMRRRFAQAIEAYWKDFDARIPRLSPQEREWLEEEIRSSEKRLLRATESPEFAIWKLNQRMETCLGTIRKVLNAMANEAARQFEMYYWPKMVNCYDRPRDVEIYLDRAGIPHDDQMEYGLVERFLLVRQSILNGVATAAMFETMGWSLAK